MPDIKTREIDRTPKIRDAAARLPKELVRDIAVKSGDSIKSAFLSSPSGGQGESMSEDASERLQNGMERTTDTGVRATWGSGKRIVQMAGRRRRGRSATGTEYTGGTQNATGGFADGQTSSPSAGLPAEEIDHHGLSGIDAKEYAIREKQTENLRIKTKEEMRTVQGITKSTERGKYIGSGKLSYSSAERIKAKSKADKLGRSSAVTRERGQRIYQAGKQLAIKGKSMAGKTGKGAKKAISSIKATVKTTVTAVRSVLAFVSAGSVVVFFVIILGVIGGIAASSGSSSAESLSQEVLAYTSTIQRYASQYGIPEYVASIQAIMMQESGGRGTDPMQASECPYNTRYPNSPGAIQDPEYSIQVGVQYYADCVSQAGCESPSDLGRLQLSWQGYNYGNGYIDWALTNYGGYSLENALEFSQQQAAAHGWSGYGDPEYVPHVQRYYSGGNIFAGLFGNQQIVTIAQNEIGASDGQKYWSWYGFTTYQEWCACFVSWCGEQAGLIDSGAIPRFSLCSDGVAWFQSQGKWQAAGSTPTAGSLVFFDWGGDGVSDHVAIVEKCENGIIYTIEGNTSTKINGESIRGVWQHTYTVGNTKILGYGMQ